MTIFECGMMHGGLEHRFQPDFEPMEGGWDSFYGSVITFMSIIFCRLCQDFSRFCGFLGLNAHRCGSGEAHRRRAPSLGCCLSIGVAQGHRRGDYPQSQWIEPPLDLVRPLVREPEVPAAAQAQVAAEPHQSLEV